MAEKLDLRALKQEIAEEQLDHKEDKEEQLTEREIPFEVVYHSPEGTLTDVLTSQILSGDDRRLVGIAAAKLSLPVQFDYLPASEQARLSAISICTYQLKDPPAWVLRWIQEDIVLLDSISRVLEEHESTYFRRDSGEGGEDSGSSRVEISTK
jgi:hypothetical protein